MLVSELSVGYRLENYRIGRIYLITEIGGYHGDEISSDELIGGHRVRQRMMTFRQFERLKFIRRLGDIR